MTTEVTGKINALLDNIKEGHNSIPNVELPTEAQVLNKSRKKKTKDVTDIRGNPKSGRFWKSKKERFSSVNKTKGLKQDFQKKTALRLELKRTKELSKQLIEQLKEKELTRKERRRDNIKRTEENKRKSEIVQVITNTAKLKRMKKKQLRFIEKRDTNKNVESNK